jgi:predicted dehydrogenase
MTETPIGFGIIGSGNMARVYADALATQVTGGRLTAVALGSRADALASEFGVATEPSAGSLAARPDVDVVVIATPHSTHLPLALESRRGRQASISRSRWPSMSPSATRSSMPASVPGPADDSQADATHGDVDAGQGLRRRGADRRDPVPPADERDARIGLRQRPAELASDPREGDAFLDWGAHACDAIRWFTDSDAIRVYADYDNFTGLPLENPTAMVQVRMANGVIAQVLMSYEIGPSGFGTRRNNQYQIVGTEGSIFWDLDRIDLVTGDRDVQTWELASWTLPDFKPRDPRRVGNTTRQIDDFIATLRAGTPPTISGADGRAAIEMTRREALGADRSSRRPPSPGRTDS